MRDAVQLAATLLSPLFAPLAIFILLSGLDDLLVAAVGFIAWLRRESHPPQAAEEKPIAIFVPLWHEDAVIARMLAHNLGAIRYGRYDLFLGAYPNDPATQEAVLEVAAQSSRVHLALGRNDGPTSKADCLNVIYGCMREYEQQTGVHFELIVTHDAEDLIHPDSLQQMNWLSACYDFIQVPVFALPTPWFEFTHGLYCDEFAQSHTLDLAARQFLGGFIPSAGVGTAYSRRALDALASATNGRIFEPTCLTEDYENGLRIQQLGFRQVFVLPERTASGFVATREYFPRSAKAAIRQRTRWVTGIVLQTWERHGWPGGWKNLYWVWRDRKGIVGSPAGLLANLMLLVFLVSPRPIPHPRLALATLALFAMQSAVRILCTSRVYGWQFALLAPVRTVYGNWINGVASLRATWRYAEARLRKQRLAWSKTEHCYPGTVRLPGQSRRLGEILVGQGRLRPSELDAALSTQPRGLRLGEHLHRQGLISTEDIYAALAEQHALPLADCTLSRPEILRAFPADICRDLKVIPFAVRKGCLLVAATDAPDENIEAAIRPYTSLKIRFHLITPEGFEFLLRQRELDATPVSGWSLASVLGG